MILETITLLHVTLDSEQRSFVLKVIVIVYGIAPLQVGIDGVSSCAFGCGEAIVLQGESLSILQNVRTTKTC